MLLLKWFLLIEYRSIYNHSTYSYPTSCDDCSPVHSIAMGQTSFNSSLNSFGFLREDGQDSLRFPINIPPPPPPPSDSSFYIPTNSTAAAAAAAAAAQPATSFVNPVTVASPTGLSYQPQPSTPSVSLAGSGGSGFVSPHSSMGGQWDRQWGSLHMSGGLSSGGVSSRPGR